MPVSGLRATSPKYTMAASMSIEPTIVKMKNFRLAYSRRSPPQMPMMKYIGTSMTSHIT